MAFKPAVAVLDACILYPFHLRNIVVQMAVDRLIEARWTDTIHDEWMRSLMTNIPSLPMERLCRTREIMNEVLPDSMVTGYERHIPSVVLPDPNDRHIVAAAIVAGASRIISWNLRDFPESALERHGLRCITPDALLVDLHAHAPDLLLASLANARRNLSKTRVSVTEFIDILRRQKLGEVAARVESHAKEL